MTMSRMTMMMTMTTTMTTTIPRTRGNRAPITIGPVRLNDVFAGQVVLIGLSQLLFGTTDPDGDILTINDITLTGGTLVQTAAGWSFATVPGMLGIVTFTYNISDGLVEIVQTATLQVVRNTVLLTPHDDVFVGTPVGRRYRRVGR
jgi:hypothetical protein